MSHLLTPRLDNERLLALLRSSMCELIQFGILAFLFVFVAILQSPNLNWLQQETSITHEFIFSGAAALASFNNTAEKTIDFRVVTGDPQLVKYVCVSYDVLPLGVVTKKVAGNKVFVLRIPRLPNGDWTTAQVGLTSEGDEITVIAASCGDLTGVKNTWHPNSIDFLDLAPIPTPWSSTKRVQLVSHPSLKTNGTKAVMKLAKFAHGIPAIDRETEIYRHLEGSGIASQFLEHVTENRGSKAVGFLLEYIDPLNIPRGIFTDKAGEKCTEALRKLHKLKVAHNDANRSNCLIRQDGTAVLIDFDQATRGEGDFSQDFAVMKSKSWSPI